MSTLAASEPADALPLYAVCDRRFDGRLRVLAQFREARDALDHARGLRWAGAAAEVLLVTRLPHEGGS